MTQSLISDGLASALYEQWIHETTNAHAYLFVAGLLKNKGFDNLAKIFENQVKEEREHADIVYALLTDLNTDVVIGAIPEQRLIINNIMDIAKLYLEREISTTESLNSVKNQAIEEENPVVEEKMRHMISLQQNEYAEATGFYDKAELTGNDWFKVLIWDLSIN